jgi:general secretion pathway protein N
VIRWILALISLALGGLLYLQWSDWPPSASVRQTAVRQGEAQTQTEPDPLAGLTPLEDQEAYAAVKERPLFRPDRRPREDEPEETAAEPSPEEPTALAGMDLAGVLIAPGATLAWVNDPSQPAPVRLRPGESLAGWTVQAIKADRLVLERQGRTDTLILRSFNAPWSSPPPPAPPPAPQQPSATAKQAPPDADKQAEAGKPSPPASARVPSPAERARTARPPPQRPVKSPSGAPRQPAGKPIYKPNVR